ncbi:NADH-quinone oxidoreductase subunit NuoF [bacterium]|nr:NADH-quinone oxidoreductase subunit NuoF [bacterium]
MGTCGIASGAQKIMDALTKEIEKGKQKDIAIIASGCMGLCSREPLITVEIFGQEPIIYQYMDKEKVLEVFEKHILGGKVLAAYALARGKEEQIKERIKYKGNLPNEIVLDKAIPGIEEIPFFSNQEVRVLKNRGIIDPEKIEDYIARDGYMGMAKALTEMTKKEIVQEILDSGLKGRGGAGFPVGIKWKYAAQTVSKVKYVVCNADEGDPGAYMDRSILEGDPHAVIEGMVIAAKAVDAHQGFIYCRAEYPLAIKILNKAIRQAKEIGLLGKNILGTGFDFDLKIYRGAGAFVCGEETALMRSIEGKRGVPRPRPPFPANAGLWEKPTVLNNVETLANISQIILKGSTWFANIGTEISKGTKVFALTGDVNNVGLVEVPIGTTLGTIIYDIGGGIPDGKKFKAAQIGGPSGGCIPAEHLNVPIDYDTVKNLGAIMGSGGLIVMDEDKCAVDIARFFMDFCQEESCGKCTPCREGTNRMLEVLTNICEGKGEEGDIELLEEIGEVIKDASLCGLGQTAANPVLSTIRYFREEYESHIKDKKCLASVCSSLFKSPCQNTCPIEMDVPSYIALIQAGRLEDAYKVLVKSNPFPVVCGRVCDYQCQFKCRRGTVDEPVAIKNLKRFITDNASRPKISPIPVTRKEKIGVIGAGPAGLTAARGLVQRGYKVVVWEELPEPGGMLRYGIPAYRLPRDILAREIEQIKNLGVEIKCNIRVGRDISFKEIKKRFDYVFLAPGVSKSQKMGIEGEDMPGILGGIEFLRDFNLNEKTWLRKEKRLGERVAVIGGGNSAVDAARCALRLGVKVNILYRRRKEDMPALLEEIKAAEEEGVKIECLVSPLKITGVEGRVKGLICQKMKLGEFDQSGRKKPVPIQGSEFTLNVDALIVAIGQRPDDLFEKIIKEIKLQTTNSKLFAGGDIVSGPSSVVKAIAAGHQAVEEIDKAIRTKNGESPYKPPLEEKIGIPLIIDEDIKELPQARMTQLMISKRINNFKEVELGLTGEKAIYEAERCLRCDAEIED